jgi:DNA-binding NarL/FixJ family response regulator
MTDILIVEDHPIVVEGLIKIFGCRNGYKCFVAETGKACMESLNAMHPSLVMLDINLPDMSGLEVCKAITSKFPLVKILIFSSNSERSIIKSMLKNGASGYLNKSASDDDIIHAVEAVLAGKKLSCPDEDECLEGRRKSDCTFFITPREREFLQMIADGFTNHEISEKMFISQLTVDSHRKNLLLKLDAKNTAALIKKGIEKGIIMIRIE